MFCEAPSKFPRISRMIFHGPQDHLFIQISHVRVKCLLRPRKTKQCLINEGTLTLGLDCITGDTENTNTAPWCSESNVMKMAWFAPGLVPLKHQNYIWKKQVWVNGSHAFGSCDHKLQPQKMMHACALAA